MKNTGTSSINTAYLLLMSLTAALGGFLFGYDWVVIGGAKPFYEAYFNIGHLPSLQGWVMGSAILGCLIGVTIAGSLADKHGRKPLMMIAAMIFIAASIGTGFSHNISTLIAYRIFGGIAIGIASTVSPMYISEISPAAVRGKFVSINQLTTVLGILSAQIVNWLIAKPIISTENFLMSWNVQTGWRWMFWVCAVPALLYFIMVFFIPESPRWMTINNKSEKAFKVFSKLGGKQYAEAQVNEVLSTKGESSKEKVLRAKGPLYYPITLEICWLKIQSRSNCMLPILVIILLRNTIIENARKVPINTFLFFAKRAVVGSNLIMKFTDLRAKCHLFYPLINLMLTEPTIKPPGAYIGCILRDRKLLCFHRYSIK